MPDRRHPYLPCCTGDCCLNTAPVPVAKPPLVFYTGDPIQTPEGLKELRRARLEKQRRASAAGRDVA